jgi:two-component system, NarL family, response regulator LiaR
VRAAATDSGRKGEGTEVQHDASTPGPGSGPLKTIIADDDPFVRRLVKEALQAAGVVVIAEASTGREAVELVLHYRPDAVLMDVVMPELDGISATKRILDAAPDQAIILLTGSEDEDMAMVGLRSGAVGFLTKDRPVEALSRALHAAARGETVISRDLTTRLIKQLRATPDRQSGMRPIHSPLTNREWEVVALIADRRSNAEIASTLVVSTATVRSHIKSILRKLNVRSREEAVELAERMRIGSHRSR